MKLSERIRKAEIFGVASLWTGSHEITEEELDKVAQLEAENKALMEWVKLDILSAMMEANTRDGDPAAWIDNIMSGQVDIWVELPLSLQDALKE